MVNPYGFIVISRNIENCHVVMCKVNRVGGGGATGKHVGWKMEIGYNYKKCGRLWDE